LESAPPARFGLAAGCGCACTDCCCCSPGGGWFWALGGRGACAQEMLCGLATGRARNAGKLPKRVAMARATVLPG